MYSYVFFLLALSMVVLSTDLCNNNEFLDNTMWARKKSEYLVLHGRFNA
jgi:hypothetical protein